MKLDCAIKNGKLVIPTQGITESCIGIKGKIKYRRSSHGFLIAIGFDGDLAIIDNVENNNLFLYIHIGNLLDFRQSLNFKKG